MFAFLQGIFLDKTGDGSFGKVVSFPFMVSAWVLGTIYGVHQLKQGQSPDEIMWTLASIGMIVYGTYKTGHVLLSRNDKGKVTVQQETTTKTEVTESK